MTNNKMIDSDRLHVLLQQYFSGTISCQEKAELFAQIRHSDQTQLSNELDFEWANDQGDATISDEDSRQMLSAILASAPPNITTPSTHLPKTRIAYLQVASIAASILIVVAAGWFLTRSPKPTAMQPLVATAEHIAPSQAAAFVRQVTLPDGSLVVLNAGSTLQFPSEFSGTTREVSLRGEAYSTSRHGLKTTAWWCR